MIFGKVKVDGDCFGMIDMQVIVWFGGEFGNNWFYGMFFVNIV